MSVEGIISRIKQDALAEAEKIKQRFLQEIEKLQREYEQYRESVLAEARQRAERERKNAYQRAIDHARSEISRKLLAHKQKLLNQFYQKVRETVENMPPEKYREFFAEVLASLGETEGEIIVGADSEVLNDEFVKVAAEKIKSNLNKQVNFTLSRTDQNFRGFILNKGKVRYDATLEAVLSHIREKTEEKVIAELFG